jgi:heme-degrading monooxygenase HmoA
MIKVVMEHRTKSREYSKILIDMINKVHHVVIPQPGLISSETFEDAADPCHVIIITTWNTAEEWKTWDESPERAASMPAIEETLAQPFNSVVLSDKVVWRKAGPSKLNRV